MNGQECAKRGCIHKVAIYKEGCKYRVEPGRVVIHQGATLHFVSLVVSEKTANLPQEILRLWFPQGVEQQHLDKLPFGTPVPVKVNGGPGVYPYAVYVRDEHGADFAEGGSAPRIIVADP